MTDATSLATAVINAYNRHDLELLEELHDPTARISFAGSTDDTGLGPWLATLARLFTILPDFAVRPLTRLADHRTAMVELNLTGTNTGVLSLEDGDRALLGTDVERLPPTGRTIDVTGVVVLLTANGRVTGERHHWPPFFLYEGLGLVTVAAKPTPRT